MIRTSGVAALAVLLMAPVPSSSAELKIFGSIGGQVRSASGVTQMGAVVYLLNRYERVVQKTLTDPNGKFRFDALSPDYYSVRVSQSSFVPASRNNLAVRAGMESYLNIQLATLFSSIELVYTSPGQTSVLSDDWKWVLRSSAGTRPVLRLVEDQTIWRGPVEKPASRPALGNLSGMVRVSAGDQGVSSAAGVEPDLGTAFALATSLFGNRELHVSGNVGYASSAGSPTAGFRTKLTGGAMESNGAPDVELTVRQTSVRQHAGNALLMGPGSPQDLPLLRTMSIKVSEQMRLTSRATLDYGALFEAVAFIERLNLFSPYAKLTYDLGGLGQLEAAYSNGAPALDLMTSASDRGSDPLLGLAVFPRVSLAGGRARVQKNQSWEGSVRKAVGSRTFAATFFTDSVRDGTVTAYGGEAGFGTGDLLPDLASNSAVFNTGNYRRMGYHGTVTQRLGEHWSAMLGAGTAGMLTVEGSEAAATTTEVRGRMRPVREPWAGGRITGQLPGPGTKLLASYVWTPNGTLGVGHGFLTSAWQPQRGVSLQVRQPLPVVPGMPGRIEMTAEVRNLLAQGYVPVATMDGGTLWLVPFPRILRGGVSFIF